MFDKLRQMPPKLRGHESPPPQRQETRLARSVCARMSSASSRDQQLFIQDISSSGIRGRVKHVPRVGETVRVKFMDRQIVKLEVRWVRGEIFGALADSSINLSHICRTG